MLVPPGKSVCTLWGMCTPVWRLLSWRTHIHVLVLTPQDYKNIHWILSNKNRLWKLFLWTQMWGSSIQTGLKQCLITAFLYRVSIMAQNCFNLLWFVTIIMCNTSFLFCQKSHLSSWMFFGTNHNAGSYKLYIQRVSSVFIYTHICQHTCVTIFYLFCTRHWVSVICII